MPYVSPDFYIHIAVAEEFANERKAAIRKGVEKLHLQCDEVQPVHIQEWAGNNDAFITTLDKKIRAYSGVLDDEDVRRLRENWISSFIKAENLLEKLNATAPSVWEDFRGIKQHQAGKLFLKYDKHSAPSDVLRQTIVELQRELVEKVPNLDSAQAQDIAIGTVSEWLHRCPLNFPS